MLSTLPTLVTYQLNLVDTSASVRFLGKHLVLVKLLLKDLYMNGIIKIHDDDCIFYFSSQFVK